ncbi:MAG: beta-galactosidase [Clostridia bacterium]|nr:beta-galactosidase [Clostridia bacterium]
MKYRYPFPFLVHGGDYNPDQWVDTPEVWDEDMRLMKLAHINSATVGIFSWSLLEPREGEYEFGWLDTVMDKLAANGVGAILATPSGARPPWLAEKYPEVLRVEESGVRNEFGVRHNHCLTSPVYREKVRRINAALAERYRDHPALTMWHVSNEYSGCCHCPLCQEAFRDWLKKRYHGDLEKLNFYWWNGFWSHRYTSWEQISSPKFRGENSVPALKLDWRRFVTEQHISFFENEIAPLKAATPDIPVTANLMGTYDGINYQALAPHLDLVSWDSYPVWEQGENLRNAYTFGFTHDLMRSLKDGQPFFLMESTPSVVCGRGVNKLPAPGRQALASMLALASGADSIQYFQWRKGRGGAEKFHGAVVDHGGGENARVFRQVAKLGRELERLAPVAGTRCDNRVAILYDWENRWATDVYCGYNNDRRDYVEECVKWYAALTECGVGADIVSETADLSKYRLVIAPCLYMLLKGAEERLASYVKNGGRLVSGYLCGVVEEHDLCFMGGVPAGELKNVFGVRATETDALPAGMPGKAGYNGREYAVEHVCDLLQADTATVLGSYQSDFYAGTPAVTVNTYGEGKAYYAAFRNDGGFVRDFCADILKDAGIGPDTGITAPENVFVKKRGDYIFVLNFSDREQTAGLDAEYEDLLCGTRRSGKLTLPVCGYAVLKKTDSTGGHDVCKMDQ